MNYALQTSRLRPSYLYQFGTKGGEYKLDLLVDHMLVVELKAVNELIPLYQAQLLTYMKLTNARLGLLINFNVALLKHGIKKFVL